MDRDHDSIRHRLTGVNVPTVERYLSVGIGVAAAGAGVTAAILGGRKLFAGGIAVTAIGAALIARGVTGVCPLTRYLARREQRGAQPDLFTGPNQGEGDRRSARAYNEHVRDFIGDDRVDPAARAAAAAIDGPEDPELRAAEEAGKAPLAKPMKNGPM